MVFMNFTVSGIGIFMAVKLDEVFPVWPHREERIYLDGALAHPDRPDRHDNTDGYADRAGLKGRARKWFGWTLIIMANLAFAAVTEIFSMTRMFVNEGAQQPIVNWTMLLADIGLATVLIALGLVMVLAIGRSVPRPRVGGRRNWARNVNA